jgi:hypothetical protein
MGSQEARKKRGRDVAATSRAEEPCLEWATELRRSVDEYRDLFPPARPESVLEFGCGLDAKRCAELALEPTDSIRGSAAFANLDHC